jgi:hypothetical protein
LKFFDEIQRDQMPIAFQQRYKCQVSYRLKGTNIYSFDGQKGGNITVLSKLIVGDTRKDSKSN